MSDELAVVIAWTFFALQVLFIAADHGWLDGLAEARLLRPFVVVVEWLGDRARDVFDVIVDLWERLMHVVDRRHS